MTTAVDMILPDSFHRLKRTSLLFSAALIILALATTEDQQALKLPLVEVGLPVAWTVSLLWLATTYYIIGFSLEVAVARRLNSEALRRAAAKGIDAELGAVAEKAKVLNRELESRVREILTELEAGRARFHNITQRYHNARPLIVRDLKKQVGQVLMNIVTQRPSGQEFDMAKRELEMEQMFADIEASWKQRVSEATYETGGIGDHQIGNARLAAENLAKRLERTAETLATVQKDMTRLANDIVGARQISFWGWEIAGAGFMFIIATAASWPRLTTAGGDLVQATGLFS